MKVLGYTDGGVYASGGAVGPVPAWFCDTCNSELSFDVPYDFDVQSWSHCPYCGTPLAAQSEEEG